MRAHRSWPASPHSGQHVAVEEVAHLRRHPRAGVDAVGDRADRHLLDGDARPHRGEDPAADHAVQLGHAVGRAGQAQAHHRHVERGVGRLAGLVAEGHEPVEAARRTRRPSP